MTHKCVSKLTIIDSDNGLSPGRRQAIIWTNAGILLIRTTGTNFSEISSEIHTFSFKKMHSKMSSAKWRPFCVGLNELRMFEADLKERVERATSWWNFKLLLWLTCELGAAMPSKYKYFRAEFKKYKMTIQVKHRYIMVIVITCYSRTLSISYLPLHFHISLCWYHMACRAGGAYSDYYPHYCDVIMSTVRLNSPASRLFTQPFIQTQIKENFKASRHWPLCGEFTGTGKFPAQMASNAENVSIWWRHHVVSYL